MDCDGGFNLGEAAVALSKDIQDSKTNELDIALAKDRNDQIKYSQGYRITISLAIIIVG